MRCRGLCPRGAARTAATARAGWPCGAGWLAHSGQPPQRLQNALTRQQQVHNPAGQRRCGIWRSRWEGALAVCMLSPVHKTLLQHTTQLCLSKQPFCTPRAQRPCLRLRSRISSALISGASPAAAAAAPPASPRPRPPSTRASHSSSTSTLASESAQASGGSKAGGWRASRQRQESTAEQALEVAARAGSALRRATPPNPCKARPSRSSKGLTLHLVLLVLHVCAVLLGGGGAQWGSESLGLQAPGQVQPGPAVTTFGSQGSRSCAFTASRICASQTASASLPWPSHQSSPPPAPASGGTAQKGCQSRCQTCGGGSRGRRDAAQGGRRLRPNTLLNSVAIAAPSASRLTFHAQQAVQHSHLLGVLILLLALHIIALPNGSALVKRGQQLVAAAGGSAVGQRGAKEE